MSSSVIRGSCAKRGRKFRPPVTSRITNEVVEQQHPRPSLFTVPVYQNEFTPVQNREPYAALLTIRPFKKDDKDTVNYLVDCLRFRLHLPSELDENSHFSTDSPNMNSSDDQNVYRRLLRSSTLASSCSLITGKRKRPNNTYRLYDRLLQLVDKFDASGVAEIFRLLLERKSAIPLFSPSSKIHYTSLLRHITLPSKRNIRLGEDKTLMRVAVISCRKRNESQTSDLLKSLFHIDSILSCDVDQTHWISNEFTAEFGCGCLLSTESGQQAVKDVLVFHVVGDFRPLWPFIMRFSEYLLIEDTSKEKDSLQSSFLETDNQHLTSQRILTSDLASIANVCLWKPSVSVTSYETKEAADCEFRYFYIEGQLGHHIVQVLRISLIGACQEQQSSSNDHKISLHEMPILQDYGFSALPCSSPDEIESSLAEITSSLGEIKKKLVALFHRLLLIKDPSQRFLSIRMFEKLLAEQSLRESESQLLNTNHQTKNQENNGAIGTRVKESVLNIEHLWREMNDLTVNLTRRASRSSEITDTSRLAAQHLLDGFCLELLDGDSDSIHVDWIKEVLHQLSKLIGRHNKERIFVLSVVGVQSSGKSTLLNTMFGVQLRTSVGQCTRGVNMQLLAVEGRPEYDYILLLDTEGTRAPEYYGLPGSEKRDNKMATLSILLSDATIVVIPGENDAAIKEILPVVKMAYQGSKLAESNGGQLSSMMFFVYNRIDTTQKEKLNNIIQTLETSLNEAFDLVQRLKGDAVEKKDSPFRDFKLDPSNPSKSDVYILGNAKKEFEPPNDVPSAAFGEALAKLREHIHQRVTSYSNGSSWKGRSIGEFSRYVGEVWCCICSADFTLSFTSVMERFNFDKTEFAFKTVEEKLAECYRTNFEILKKEMVEYQGKLMISNGTNNREEEENLLKSFDAMLREKILPVEVVLDEKMKLIVNKKGREKWSIQFQERWRISKLEQSQNWSSIMKTSFTTLFYLEHHVENFKKKMRIEIGAFFKSTRQRTSQWKKERKLKKFDSLYCNILTEAVEEFPDLDVVKEIGKVYQESSVIKTRQVEFKDEAIHSVKPTQSPTFQQNEESNKKFLDCCRFIKRVVSHNLTGKLCYDSTITSRVIIDIDSAISFHHITAHSEVQKLHIFGRQLLTTSMKTIQQEWESNNSIYVRLQEDSNREAMLDYFMISSVGVKKTKLFASVISKLLTRSLATAFGEEMVLRTCENIRSERWLHDSRYMRKHMDLHLVDLLEKEKISQVLALIYKPQPLYLKVLRQLVSQNVPDITKESSKFSDHVKRAIQRIQFDAADGVRGIAQRFVCSLQNSFSKSSLKSEHLSKLFLMDVRNEFDDCDSEDEKFFYDICVDKLTKAVDSYRPPKNSTLYARNLSSKVIDYMRMTNDPAALPRCDESCPMCSSFCMEAINHDTRIRPHDAVHQPGGLVGMYNVANMELFSNACNHGFEVDGKFFWNDSEVYRYRDFSKVFIGWNDPRIFEEQPLGEYILATYNDRIAKKYGVKACEEIPLRFYTRNLAGIRAQLEMELGF